jgi:hypothetical protein
MQLRAPHQLPPVPPAARRRRGSSLQLDLMPLGRGRVRTFLSISPQSWRPPIRSHRSARAAPLRPPRRSSAARPQAPALLLSARPPRTPPPPASRLSRESLAPLEGGGGNGDLRLAKPGSRKTSNTRVHSWPGQERTVGSPKPAAAHLQATKQAQLGSGEPGQGLATQPNTPYMWTPLSRKEQLCAPAGNCTDYCT